ncbi:MAG: hypothetical protein CMO64_01850 [Verrucomicrobiales bacterium]|nr:hypothetical protein [Verrucomicrobiales bacterium]|tara:strand:+ start:1624 stop:2094 length:471 start_codon:yes stop_codon:yes gene_type:complete
MRKALAIFLFAALTTGALAQVRQSQYFTAVPYVHPDWRTIDMSFRGGWNWQTGMPLYMSGGGRINNQFQLWNGVPLNIGGHTSSYRQFGSQRVPFLGSAPLVGGLFRNRWQSQGMNHSNFSIKATIVDPAGNPVMRQETAPWNRIPGIPKPVGLIP